MPHGDSWLPMVTHGGPLRLMVTHGTHGGPWRLMAAHGCPRRPMAAHATHGGPWRLMAVHGCPRRSMTAHGDSCNSWWPLAAHDGSWCLMRLMAAHGALCTLHHYTATFRQFTSHSHNTRSYKLIQSVITNTVAKSNGVGCAESTGRTGLL